MAGTVAGKQLHPGMVVAGRYVIEAQLGGGGMGMVYAARDQRLDRLVALKALIPGASTEGGVRERMEREAKAVASLRHPGIVTLFDILDHAGGVVLVMELVPGRSLRQRLHTEGRLPAADVGQLVTSIAEGLAAAHAQCLVHRDVKPDNVVQRPDGRTALLDFGVAKALGVDLLALGQTATADGMIIGTPAYLSPEQARGEPLSPASDQFALAVTAYELLAGTLPWPSASFAVLVSAILSGTPRPLSSEVPGLAASVDGVLARALAKAPAERFPDVIAFAHELERALGAPRTTNGHGATVDPLSRTELALRPRAGMPGGRHRRRTAAMVVVVVLGTCGMTVWVRRRVATGAAGGPPGAFVVSSVPSSDAEDFISSTPVGEARARFDAAERLLALGDAEGAKRAADEAVVLDPRFTSAHLLRALISFRRSAPLDDGARRAFAVALAGKPSLPALAAALTDALVPAFLDPPDWRECEARLDAAVRRWPQDARVWHALGTARTKLGRIASAMAAFDQAARHDTRATASLWLHAQLQALADDTAGAERSLASCLSRDAGSVPCRRLLAQMAEGAGDCRRMDKLARETTSLAPASPDGYRLRAISAAALREPDAAVAELLESKRALLPPGDQPLEAARDRADLARRRGDLGEALRELAVGEQLGATAPAHVRAAMTVARAELQWEIGERRASGRTCMAFLDRTAALMIPERPYYDVTGRMLACARDGAALSTDDARARRDAWISGWRARRDPEAWRSEGLAVWWSAYDSLLTLPPHEAAAALSALAELDVPANGGSFLSSFQASFWGQSFDATRGTLLVFAGRLAEARQWLEPATNVCSLVPPARLLHLLGTAREAADDRTGACESYSRVLALWGKAKPRSVTAEAARSRARALGCPTARTGD